MGRASVLLFLGSVAALLACKGESNKGSEPQPSVEDERGSVGPANPASVYCEKLGYTNKLEDELCVFPDGTSCPQFKFLSGECSPERSYCNVHGGTVAPQKDSYTGICTVNGKQCPDHDYFESGVCD